jgi:hypothetical protein
LGTLLHDIAYADDPMKGSIPNNRQVPNALKCHYLHEFDNRVIWRASLNLNGFTVYAYSRVQMIRFGARAVRMYLAGAVGTKGASCPDWREGSTSDFVMVLDALRFSDTPYEELVRQTETLCEERAGQVARLADYLEVHGMLDARKIAEICSWR